MEHGEEQDRQHGGEGEDHREGPPGYDLDEQEAIEALEKEGEGEGDPPAPGA